ncbi:hypothetical protein AX16_007314 [Volvariella volvacea WC 439]|nr:hypothetical protein AX16_007314 [Volvariella volvacea WC 439]
MKLPCVLYILASLGTYALSNPIKEARQPVHPIYSTSAGTCQPNFEGVGVSITNVASEWGTSPASLPGVHIINTSHRGPIFANADFKVERNGEHPPRYIIRDIEHTHLIASIRNHRLLLSDQHHNDQSQLWDINCGFCATNVAGLSGHAAGHCNITWVPNGYCVTTDRKAENPLFLEPCTGSNKQQFNFWTPTTFT